MRRDNYSLTIVTIPRFRVWFNQNKETIIQEYNLKKHDEEDLYDYCVGQAFDTILRRSGSRQVGLFKHDLYNLVYKDHVKFFLVDYLSDKLEHYEIEYVWQEVKLLVLGDKLILGAKK